MNYFIYGFFVLIIFFVLINYLRKIHWDAIHNNLFDLADDIGGDVVRKGFLARPVFIGRFKKCELTINFSQEKKQKGRANYINVSLNKKVKKTLTILSVNWLESQNESMEDLKIIKLKNSEKYGIRSKNTKIIDDKKQKKYRSIIEQLHPFNYIFIGETGIIFEKESQNVAMDTKLSEMKKTLDGIFKISEIET